MRDASSNDQQQPVGSAPARDAWSTPWLRVLGTLSELTASGSKSGKENHGNVRGNRP